MTKVKKIFTFAIKNQRQVDVLYTDFVEAFDKVYHNILISKLTNFNLPENLIFDIHE